MESREQGSVTGWLGALKDGDREAVQPLWERYYARLVGLARGKLQNRRRAKAAADEEDAALSAFHSFCEGAERGRFPLLGDRDDLWKLLVVITTRKARAQAVREGRIKRGAGLLVGEDGLKGGASPEDGSPFDLLPGQEPTPEFAAQVAEEVERLLDALRDDELRRIAVDRMEGYTADEIAGRLGCARRTVARRLDLIRKTWEAEEP